MAFEAWDISFLEHKQTKHYPCDWNQHQMITDGYVSSDIYLENTLALKIFTYFMFSWNHRKPSTEHVVFYGALAPSGGQ